MAMYVQFLRKTAATWTSTNPVLKAGQIGIESDTLKGKFGDGTTAWTSLSYIWTVAGAGGGDASTNTASSVVSEVALFADTSGKLLKRATGSGIAKLTSGVLGTGTAGTDFYAPGSTDVAVADGGTGASTLTGVLKGNGTSAVTGGALLGDLGTTGADFSMNSHKITSLTDGSSSGDAVNKGQLDLKANLNSPTFTGTVTLPIGLTGLAKASAGVVTAVTAPSGAVVGTTDTQTLTNKRVTKRVGTTASSATPSIDCDSYDAYDITALAAAITSITITGTPTHDQQLILRIKDNGSARAMATGSSIISSGVASFPSTTVISKVHTIGLRYDANFATKWVVLAADATGY